MIKVASAYRFAGIWILIW